MNKIYVIAWEQLYCDGSVSSGVFPKAYKSFNDAYEAMKVAWEADKNEMIENGLLEENINNLTTYEQDHILYDNYDEHTEYIIRELEVK